MCAKLGELGNVGAPETHGKCVKAHVCACRRGVGTRWRGPGNQHIIYLLFSEPSHQSACNGYAVFWIQTSVYRVISPYKHKKGRRLGVFRFSREGIALRKSKKSAFFRKVAPFLTAPPSTPTPKLHSRFRTSVSDFPSPSSVRIDCSVLHAKSLRCPTQPLPRWQEKCFTSTARVAPPAARVARCPPRSFPSSTPQDTRWYAETCW